MLTANQKKMAAELAKNIRPVIAEYRAKRNAAAILRSNVAKIQRDTLAECELRVSAEWQNVEIVGARIVDPDRIYLANKAACDVYFAELDRAYAAAGFEGLAAGQCPALIAASEAREAERNLIREAAKCPQFSDMTEDRLAAVGGDWRQRWVDLLCTLGQ